MYTSLVEEFTLNGHKVVVLAPGVEKTGINIEKGIQVLRVKTLPIKNVPNYLKGVSNLLLPLQFERALKKYYSNEIFDLIISPTPPITLVDLSVRLKKKFKSTIYLILRDIFPQNAVDLGFINKRGILYRYFRQKEVKLYNNADFIGCMSQGNIEYILKHNPKVKPEKLHELPNFQKPYYTSEIPLMDIKVKYGIQEKFVVVFGGNMGKPQQLENVLELAKSCMVFPDVIFLLLGEGVKINKIVQIAENEKIRNIRIHRTISKYEYQDLLKECHIGLISLHKDFTIPNIPSKALDYFNVGIPVLASIDRATDFGQILEQEEAGLWSFAGDHDSFFKNFTALYHNKIMREKMSKNGKRYFESFLTPQIAYQTIINIIN
ncbi:MAG: glycosyltransferase family 4 protein [Saprospiraceae bacterium]|nr:glycosyltransferase family 4 protein [Saprospiraceae bacterium]